VIHVLVVDDEIEPRLEGCDDLSGYMSYYVLELEEAGFAVSTASGASEGLQIATEIVASLNPRDKFVAVVDITMPATEQFPNSQGLRTGLLMAQEMHKRFASRNNCRIVLLSNNVPPDETSRLSRVDCQKLLNDRVVDRVLFKPDTDPKTLVAVISGIVGSK
jgi:CheY-like chemotaxis protein